MVKLWFVNIYTCCETDQGGMERAPGCAPPDTNCEGTFNDFRARSANLYPSPNGESALTLEVGVEQ